MKILCSVPHLLFHSHQLHASSAKPSLLNVLASMSQPHACCSYECLKLAMSCDATQAFRRLVERGQEGGYRGGWILEGGRGGEGRLLIPCNQS